MSQREIASEQAYLDRAHARLEAMRESARAVSADVVAEGSGGTFAARVERDIRVELSSRRLAQLDIGDEAVAFGRLDFSSGMTVYIGRIGVSDEGGDQLVVDWRAPVAEPFYRATPAEPLGVARRRHFITRGRTITGLDDELLDRTAAGDLVLMGEGALLAGLESARTGRMHDIVGTIQREQDAIIRSALKGILVVQGGPGTGKTAVALHRAAYLLYTYRQRLQRDGVLIVGPNPVFLRYIEQVLPSLGEHSVVLATLGELYAGGARPCHIEEQAVAELKGDRRMAGVIEKALSTRERPLKSALTLAYGVHQLTVRPAETRRIVESARKRRGTHNARRLVVERMLAQAFVRAWRSAEERLASGKRKEASRSESARLTNQMASHLRRDLAARAALERMWPLLSPEELLHDLFGSRALLRAATRGALGEQEAALLYRKRSASLREIPWSEADMALLDEAAQLLGPAHRQGNGRPQVRRGERDEEAWMLERVADEAMPDCPACGAQLAASRGASGWRCQQCGRRFGQDELSGESQLFNELRQRVERLSNNSHGPAQTKAARLYGHVVVDEAQGVSPMQWRSLARRCPPGSFTVVGDLSQATSSYAATTWEEALRSLPGRAERRLEELTVNYRTPSEVMTLAARVLAEAAPSLTPPRSVRASGQQPLLRRVANGELEKEVVKAALAERRALGEGKIVVIAPDARLASLAGELEAPVARGHEGLSPREAREILDAPLVVLGVDAVRGLEFDSVVLVDPAEIVSEHSQGLRAVYVALTRTTKRLQVIHSRELPRSLRQPPS